MSLGHGAISQSPISALASALASAEAMLFRRSVAQASVPIARLVGRIVRRHGQGKIGVVNTEAFNGISLSNASTTWTPPAGVTRVFVEAWGAGGNGGDAAFDDSGGGGGGGGYAGGWVAVTPGTAYTIQAGGTSLGLGESYFSGPGVSVHAYGGAPGENGGGAGAGAGGNGGPGLSGVRTYSGGNGGSGYQNSTSGQGGGGGGGGGSTSAGSNGVNGALGLGAAGGAGGIVGGGSGGSVSGGGSNTAGAAPGGGGAGGSQFGTAGGTDGAPGRVLLTYETTPRVLHAADMPRLSNQKMIQGQVPQVLVGTVARRFGRADARSDNNIGLLRRSVRQVPILLDILRGGKTWRSGQQPDAKSDVPHKTFMHKIKPNFGLPTVHPKGSIVRAFGHADSSGKNILPFRRAVSQPLLPAPSALEGTILRRKQWPDAPPAPTTDLVPNLVRRVKSPEKQPFTGTVTRRPDLIRYSPPGPTETLFLIRRQVGTPPVPSMLQGRVKRREGIAANESIPRRVLFARQLLQQLPTPDALEGKVKRRKGVSQNIIPPASSPQRRLRRKLPSKRPPIDVMEGHTKRRFGVTTPIWITYTEMFEQGYRVADEAYSLYELFVGEDAEPTFGAPVATSPTLPFSWTPTPPASGTKVLHIVVRKRNKYNLSSMNIFSALKIIDNTGAGVADPVAAPIDVVPYDDVTGYVRVMAKYSSADDTSPADRWDVYVKIGSVPVPGVDVVTYTAAMKFLGPFAVLNRKIGPYSAGAVAYIVVVARRNSDGTIAAADSVTLTLAFPPDLDSGSLFGGTAFEQL